MIKSTIESLYFNWISELAIPDESLRKKYTVLLEKLYDTSFYYVLEMDKNRYVDGVDLRWRFSYIYGINDDIVSQELDYRECSVLEMMVALAVKCEESFMYDIKYGDRTNVWFTDMLESIGINYMTNDVFNEEIFNVKMTRLLNRQYLPNGDGGLFTIKDCPVDLREEEIWCQLNRYVSEIITQKGV